MRRYILISLLMMLFQVLLTVFLGLTPYFVVALLPTIVLFLPIRTSTPAALVLAFVAGLLVDLMTDGVLGLTVVALLPVALSRFAIVKLVFGEDIISRKEDITLVRQGVAKSALGIAISLSIFLIIFIWADSAGMRPFWFNFARFIVSLIFNTFFGLIVAMILTSDNVARWK